MRSSRALSGALLVVAACQRTGEFKSSKQEPLFREVSSETGLNFHHVNGATGDYYMPEIIGSGVAAFDYDNDGDLDLYFVQGDFLEGKKMADASFPPPPGWKPGSRLFRNELIPSGKLRFTDVTEGSGAGFSGAGMGTATGDYDNDGWVDLLVTAYGRMALYRNRGNGTFLDVTRQAGVEDSAWNASACFFDYDRDGRLDLFVAHYVNFTFRKRQCRAETGEPDYCLPQAFSPTVDRLYHNEGNGRFSDVTGRSGIGAASGPGLGVVAADFDGDTWPDVYVANDGAASHLWINQRDGTFREQALEMGVAYSMDGRPQAGMGLALGDFDNDGDDDLFKTNLVREGANLYRNSSQGFFSDSVAEMGLLGPTRGLTGFGAAWLDYDNDGWLDLLVANGAVSRVESQAGSPFPYRQPNQLFHNGAGRMFREVSAGAGAAFQVAAVGRGIALGDFDNDGALDFAVSNNNGPARLFLNQARLRGGWLTVRVEGGEANQSGVGAAVTVIRAGAPPLRRPVHTAGSYLSASDPRVHFGLGSSSGIEAVRVLWPDGAEEQWSGTQVNRLVVLKKGSGVPVPVRQAMPPGPGSR